MGNQPSALHHGVNGSVESRPLPCGTELSEQKGYQLIQISSGTELSEQKRYQLIQIFCGSEPIDPAKVEALVSGKPGHVVGSRTFFPQNGDSPFLEAARAGKLASLQFMLERYSDAIDVNARGRTLHTGTHFPYHRQVVTVDYHVTALIESCFGRSEVLALKVVKYLISEGALVNVASCYGITPLMAAAKAGHVTVVQYLVECGAHVNAVSVMGTTALHHAAYMGSVDAVQFLIRKGAHVNHRDHYGMCAIHMAAMQGKGRVVHTLIGAGANTLSSQGNPTDPKYVPSPILLAASRGCLGLVEDLQKHCSQTLCSDAYLLYAIPHHIGALREPILKRAFDMRAKCSDPVEYLPPCAAYGNRTEVQTFAQCCSLPPAEKEYQVLIIKERCLGVQDRQLQSDILQLAARSSHVKAIALLSQMMLSLTNEVDHIPTECIIHNHYHMMTWNSTLRAIFQHYSSCSLEDKRLIDLTNFLQFFTHGLDCVKSSIQKLECPHGYSRDDMSMLTLHGLRFLCLWLQQERANDRNPLFEGSEQNNVGQKFTSAYLHAPSKCTLLCQALSTELLLESGHTITKSLVEELISALLHWGADAVVNDPCVSSGQRPLHMAALHHGHRVVSNLIEAGAHLDAVNSNGRTALDIAIEGRNHDVISVFPECTAPLPLYCQVSRFIAESTNSLYCTLQLPTRVKAFISMHDKGLRSLS